MRLKDTEERLRGLLMQACAGDNAAYRDFLLELSRHLRGFLRRRLGRMPDAVEDLVQETLLAVHNQRHTYDPGQPLTAWIHAIARYKLVDWLRVHVRQDRPTEPLEDHEDVLANDDSAACEARRDLGRLLERLPDRQRLPIIHVKLHGRSVVETARLTGMSVSAVKVGVHRGLKALAASVAVTARSPQ